MNAIEADGLGKAFGDRTALDSATFRVARGHIFGYLGPNGAGKTTTLHLLLGLLRPTKGTATVAGFDVARQATEVRKRCGALLEHHGLYERLTALENLTYHGELQGMGTPEIDGRSRELLEDMGLWDRRRERVGTWSRGMKQRLAIARALLHRPEVLFLDEPTAGFDPAAAASLRAELQAAVRHDGLTVFLTTHNLHEAQGMCNEVAVLRDGRIAASGAPDTLRGGHPQVLLDATGLGDSPRRLRDQHGVLQVEETPEGLRITLQDRARVPDLVRLVVGRGAAVHEVRWLREDLEDTFLQLVGAGR